MEKEIMENEQNTRILATVLNVLMPFTAIGQAIKGHYGKMLMFWGLLLINISLLFVIIGFFTLPLQYLWMIIDAYRT